MSEIRTTAAAGWVTLTADRELENIGRGICLSVDDDDDDVDDVLLMTDEDDDDDGSHLMLECWVLGVDTVFM